ncbi:MAG: dihydroxyacetone kinase subunit DhaL [Fusobacterium sp.]
MQKIIIEIINKIADVINENKDYLTDLDRAIGDGDHGVNLNRGFTKLKEESEKYVELKNNEIITKIAMTLISNVGGASGALYGTAFMKMGIFMKGKENISKKDIPEIINIGIEGIKMRGKSDIEEKTMLDTLVPFCNYLKENINKEINIGLLFSEALEKAKSGRDSTIEMIAKKGRASYLKERSIGHLDPGAASSYMILETITEVLRGKGI